MNTNKQSARAGFTLIEVLVVISIIGFLASIVLVSVSSARLKARNVQRKQNLTQVQKALELYYNDNAQYPSTGGAWWSETSLFGSHGLSGPNGYIPNLAPTYLARLPHDINTGVLAPGLAPACNDPTLPGYTYSSDGTNYKLTALCLPERVLTTVDPLIDPDRDGGPFGSGSSGCDGAGDNANIFAWAVFTPNWRCQ